ncbi:MAG TPA: serine/threonine-protein kinase [Kofleriaceae bacterium]
MQEGSMIGGRYQLVDMVAEGGLSTVWQGVTRSSEVFARPVAVKVMKREFTTIGGPYLSMFLEEARIGATLQHANLIQVLDFIVEATAAGPVYCLVLEWVDGIDLKSVIKIHKRLEKPLGWGIVAAVALRVLRGLAAAHERRLPDGTVAPVIHRDVSPQNILMAINGDVKLADFGMARARDRIAEQTAPGIVKGTLSYMAPELLVGQPPTPASDLFSTACTLWEALAGRRLFDGKTDPEVFALLKKCEIPPLDDIRSDIPIALAEAIQRALAADPAARFPSARAMVHELSEILRVDDSWGDADVIVGTAVSDAREARQKLKFPAAE